MTGIINPSIYGGVNFIPGPKLKYTKLKESFVHQPMVIQPRNGDAGYDLCAVTDSIIEPQQTLKIRTGLCFEIPTGYVGLIQDRSSVGSKGIKVMGGVIDSSYRGEVLVCLCNTTSLPFEIKGGSKISQMLLIQYANFILEEVDSLSDSLRQNQGFGSTDENSSIKQ